MKARLFVSLLSVLFVQNCWAGQKSESVTLTGRILDPNGEPVAGALIYVLPNMDENNQQFSIIFSVGESAISNAEGKYDLQFNPKGFREIRTDFFDLYVRNIDRNLIAIKKFKKEASKVDATLSNGIIFTGRIFDVNENPISNASLSYIIPATDNLCKFSFDKNCPLSDENGNYEIRALWPEKRYSIEVVADGYKGKFIDKWSCIDDALDNKIEFEKIVLSVPKKTDMSISGTVLDINGNPKANVIIYSSGYEQPSRETKTDEQGKYTLENICAGPIDLEVVEKDTMFERHMFSFAVVDGGTKDIEIILSGPWWYELQSLAGKSLPNFESIKIEITPEQIKDKIILVCFWDMEQRPSRNCILQLSKRAQELKAKDVVIVTVQASKIEKTKLDEWLKDQHFPFPVGMIQADEEKTRFNWGIKSLPWLILTDKKHIVQAEGFSVSELGDKIK